LGRTSSTLGCYIFLTQKSKLEIEPQQMLFCCKKIMFLGHVVRNEGTKPNLGKIDAILHFLKPKIVTNIRSFLGLIGYYRNYVQGYSWLAALLFELAKKDVAFVWSLDYQHAFEAMKKGLVDAPALVCPNFKKPFCLDVDWSAKGIGAILL